MTNYMTLLMLPKHYEYLMNDIAPSAEKLPKASPSDAFVVYAIGNTDVIDYFFLYLRNVPYCAFTPDRFPNPAKVKQLESLLTNHLKNVIKDSL